MGGVVKILVGDRFVFGSLIDFDTHPNDTDALIATVELMGESGGSEEGTALDFERGVNCYPLPGDRVSFACEADFEQIVRRQDIWRRFEVVV